jgi:glycosyltransferase involved in cell wall biosynthesis
MSEGISGLRQRACEICPDVFILQIQDANIFTPEVIKTLREDHPNAQFVSWNGDYHPANLFDSRYIEVMRLMDVASFAVASIKDQYKAAGINWVYWQIGYEESYGEPDKTDKRHDVVFLGNGYSEQRKDLGRFLLDYRGAGVSVGLYGSWPRRWSLGSNLYDFNAGRKIYRGARIAISDQQWPDATGYVSNRLFQAMAAGGCLVLQQYFDGMEEYLGLYPGSHLDVWTSHEELGDKIKYWLDHEEKREMLVDCGHEFMLRHHSFDVRVRELLDVLER